MPASLAAGAGAGIWLVATLVSGRREAWDASSYWTSFYPLALAASAWLGYRYPNRSWRWPLILFAAQFVTMCLLAREAGSLWPLGLALFGVLALPGVVVSRMAARRGRVA
ncbi:MAG TPA: hypothetical protein VN858_08750 [Casimicrobiaceae bacterium]|nr:hypothetical protein [Casimicrobiaceae bacterium]